MADKGASDLLAIPGYFVPIERVANPRGPVFGLRAKLWALAVTSTLAVALVSGSGILAMAWGHAAAEDFVNREIAALQSLGELQAAMGRLAKAEVQIVVNYEVK